MAFINQTHYQYYNTGEKFTATADQTEFQLTLDPLPISKSKFLVFVNGAEVDDNIYNYSATGSNAGKVIFTFGNQRSLGDTVEIKLINPVIAGNYRYISLSDIVNNFMVSYVGKDKIIPRIKRTDVLFHAKRGIQEFSYDITKVEKIQEIEVPDTLAMVMPQDYVDYVQISRIDDVGFEHTLYPARHTSIPSESILQDNEAEYLFDDDDSLLTQTPETQTRFKNMTSTVMDDSLENINTANDRYEEFGRRFGINPELANKNGSFVIDEINGKIHFSSDLVNKIITLKYVSDGMGTDAEMKVHKFAEEAIYKHIIYSVVSSRINFPEYIVNRYKRDRFATMRNAKLRLANLNPRELAQVMRNKSKNIKH
tara:strand:- start:942 stop:2045 length:1104 start_codon:yes stop_codon:yes gene_type:complete